MEVPIGSSEFPLSKVSNGMRNYLLSLAKDRSLEAEYGASVDGKLIVCMIRSGKILCHYKNLCVAVKSKILRRSTTSFFEVAQLKIASECLSLDEFLLDGESEVINIDNQVGKFTSPEREAQSLMQYTWDDPLLFDSSALTWNCDNSFHSSGKKDFSVSNIFPDNYYGTVMILLHPLNSLIWIYLLLLLTLRYISRYKDRLD